MKKEVYSKCGMRCDLCLLYRPNVEVDDKRADICKVCQKMGRSAWDTHSPISTTEKAMPLKH